MALTKEQKVKLYTEWFITLDDQEKFKLLFKSTAQLKIEISDFMTARKTKLEADKATLNQAFLDEQIASIDTQAREVQDIKDNF